MARCRRIDSFASRTAEEKHGHGESLDALRQGEFELQFMRKVVEAWASAVRQAGIQLTDVVTDFVKRASQLNTEGRIPQLMHRIAKLAERFALYGGELEKQVADARAFLNAYRSIDNRHMDSINLLLKEDLENMIGSQLVNLEQSVRDLLQIGSFRYSLSLDPASMPGRVSDSMVSALYRDVTIVPAERQQAVIAIKPFPCSFGTAIPCQSGTGGLCIKGHEVLALCLDSTTYSGHPLNAIFSNQSLFTLNPESSQDIPQLAKMQFLVVASCVASVLAVPAEMTSRTGNHQADGDRCFYIGLGANTHAAYEPYQCCPTSYLNREVAPAPALMPQM
ncbi:hypothetical protein ISF_07850 [Cordyceps fumosorosea ARSEF 2679]|uniref:Uncharacterized protein n=1 Tax=Cordyceps fumosorosea (strain ARSEF 2679) TaxID=1081104 RepID=A0A162IDU4_CORFA|nr:hypothetical protein ISF_07850 [Cordyceps fumosorosea ARSEF 2679]OAA55745.1 hypothetical protein ISF_07850 [Cordyceps fumosorosea ARSEF 2679]